MSSKQIGGFSAEDIGFAILVLLVTLAFAWLMTPYFSAILWGLVAGIVFGPLYRRLAKRLGGREGLAAALTLLIILALVILPAILMTFSLIQEAVGLYTKLQSNKIDFAAIFDKLSHAMPRSVTRLARQYDLMDAERARELIRSGLSAGLGSVATRALTVGQGALAFLAQLGIMLYLTYFLLRDGESLGRRFSESLPLRPQVREHLIDNFIRVVRATMKGTVLVAVLQGIVGGVIFALLGIESALLWGLLMGFFSLVPAVGTGIVWVPVALYLLLTGSVWEGSVLVFCGFFVIGLIDNLLRPILVGKDTKLPDFVVLIATVAGLELFGLTGFIVGPIIAALFIALWDIVTDLRGHRAAGPDGASVT
jgi:predicted PurR-regulated permease PerM